MGDSNYHLCYRTLVLDDYEQSDLSIKEFYINEAIGTWQVHSVGVVKGAGVPTIPSIINYNGVKSAGIDITQGIINLKADTTNFLMPDGSANPNVSIDHNTGTLKAVNGEFSGIVHASVMYSNVETLPSVIDPTVNPAYMYLNGGSAELPSAAQYIGMELRFFTPFPMTRVYVAPAVLSVKSGEKIYKSAPYDTTNPAIVQIPVDSYTVPLGKVVTLKAINSTSWKVISGDNGGYTGNVTIGGKTLYFNDGILTGIV
jgi:hypothetical protein